MVKVLHTRNATLWYTTFYTYTHFNFDLNLLHYLDTCKARSANKKIMSKKKKRIDAIVFHLEKKAFVCLKKMWTREPFHGTTANSVCFHDFWPFIYSHF